MRPIKKKNYFFNNYEEFLESELKDNHPLVGIEQITQKPKDYQGYIEECKKEGCVELTPEKLLQLAAIYEKNCLAKDTKKEHYYHMAKKIKDVFYDIHVLKEEYVLIIAKSIKKSRIGFLYADSNHVHFIFTREEYRGKGIGKALYLLAIKHFPEFKHDTPNMLEASLNLACNMYFKTDYREVLSINKQRLNE